MNIKNCTADNTVKAGEAPFHIKPGQKEDARGSPPPKKKKTLMCPVLLSAFTPSPNPVLGKHAVGPLINVTLPVLPQSPSPSSSFPSLSCSGPPCFVLSPPHEVIGFLHLFSVFEFPHLIFNCSRSLSLSPPPPLFFITIFTFSSLSVDNFPLSSPFLSLSLMFILPCRSHLLSAL